MDSMAPSHRLGVSNLSKRRTVCERTLKLFRVGSQFNSVPNRDLDIS